MAGEIKKTGEEMEKNIGRRVGDLSVLLPPTNEKLMSIERTSATWSLAIDPQMSCDWSNSGFSSTIEHTRNALCMIACGKAIYRNSKDPKNPLDMSGTAAILAATALRNIIELVGGSMLEKLQEQGGVSDAVKSYILGEEKIKVSLIKIQHTAFLKIVADFKSYRAWG